MEEDYLIRFLETSLEPVGLPEREQLKTKLSAYINDLITHDFNKLVHILYRVDVDEQTLKEIMLQNKDTDSSPLIADLIIDRQIEKSILKKRHWRQDNIPENDKW